MAHAGTGRSVVLAPGGNYGVDGPLLMYARLAVTRRDGNTHPIRWQLAGGRDFSQQRGKVASQVAAAIDELTAATGAAPVVIGKSLGSLAAPIVADRGLTAIWFTPLLTDQPTVAALRRATGPSLLVGGTADQSGMAGLPGRSPGMWWRSTAPITAYSSRARFLAQRSFWGRC
jgi:hypothetical protein